MRRSVAALALIRHVQGDETLWLSRWNRNWQALALVGGHKRDDETFRDCMIREITEELAIEHGAEFTVSDNSRKLPEFVDWSASAGEETQYTMEFFDVVLLDANVDEHVAADPENSWLTVDEIKAKRAKTGRAVSPSVEKLLRKLGLIDGNNDDSDPSSYQPTPIDTASVKLPKTIVELTERLAENAHDTWAAGRLAEGWTYGPDRNDQQKKHPCLVPYTDLPESEKQYDRNSALETLKATIALGYRIERGG